LTQQRILLADDEPRLLHVVGLYLSMEGFEVTEASDGSEAIAMLDKDEFDLAILDVMMPGVDGIEVCRHIRSQPRTQTMPVLVFTSLSSDKDVERARLAGANHLITKPFSLPGLGAVVRSCFTDAPALTG
jgi:DNA-binding response OmpR family regulator